MNYEMTHLAKLFPWSSYPTELFSTTYDGNISFASSDSLSALNTSILSALTSVENTGVVAGRVDVVAHSMGGLLIRQFSGTSNYNSLTDRMSGRFNTIITLDTPESGSGLATYLLSKTYSTLQATIISDPNASGFWTSPLALNCSQTATVKTCLAQNKMPVTTGAIGSLVPGSKPLQAAPSPVINGATWNAVTSTDTTGLERNSLGLMIRAIYPAESDAPSLDSIVGAPDDDIVSIQSQTYLALNFVTFSGLAHTDIKALGIALNDSVKNSPSVVKQVACWLRNPVESCAPQQASLSKQDSEVSVTSRRLDSHSLDANFPEDAILGQTVPIKIRVSDVVDQLSLEQSGPFNAGDSGGSILTEANGKTGSFLVSFTPTVVGLVDVIMKADFRNGTFGGIRQRVNVSIDPDSILRVNIDHDHLRRLFLQPGQKLQLEPSITVRGVDEPVLIGNLAHFRVIPFGSDSSITVSPSGLLSANRLGVSAIEASVKGKTDRIDVEVRP